MVFPTLGGTELIILVLFIIGIIVLKKFIFGRKEKGVPYGRTVTPDSNLQRSCPMCGHNF